MQLVAAINEADGPPPGIPVTGLQLLFDKTHGTAVVLQLFDTAEDMGKGAEAFKAMVPVENAGQPRVRRHVPTHTRAPRHRLTPPRKSTRCEPRADMG